MLLVHTKISLHWTFFSEWGPKKLTWIPKNKSMKIWTLRCEVIFSSVFALTACEYWADSYHVRNIWKYEPWKENKQWLCSGLVIESNVGNDTEEILNFKNGYPWKWNPGSCKFLFSLMEGGGLKMEIHKIFLWIYVSSNRKNFYNIFNLKLN